MQLKKDKKFEIDSKHSRNFSDEFKKSKVKDLLEKRITIRDLSRLYQVSRTSVYKWIYLYSDIKQGTKQVQSTIAVKSITRSHAKSNDEINPIKNTADHKKKNQNNQQHTTLCVSLTCLSHCVSQPPPCNPQNW